MTLRRSNPIRALVEDADGNLIRPDPWDRVDLGFLPADVNNDGVSNTADSQAVQTCLATVPCAANPDMARMDIDRNTVFETRDRTRVNQLLQGINNYQGLEW